jgi:hypothetical protein
MNLERDLRQALGRKQPPRDVAERIAAGIAAEPERASAGFWRARRGALRFAAAVLVVVSGGLGASVVRQQGERRRGELAAQQLRTALHIASETLNDARLIVRESR